MCCFVSRVLFCFPGSTFSRRFIRPFVRPSTTRHSISRHGTTTRMKCLFRTNTRLNTQGTSVLQLMEHASRFRATTSLTRKGSLPTSVTTRYKPHLLRALRLTTRPLLVSVLTFNLSRATNRRLEVIIRGPMSVLFNLLPQFPYNSTFFSIRHLSQHVRRRLSGDHQDRHTSTSLRAIQSKYTIMFRIFRVPGITRLIFNTQHKTTQLHNLRHRATRRRAFNRLFSLNGVTNARTYKITRNILRPILRRQGNRFIRRFKTCHVNRRPVNPNQSLHGRINVSQHQRFHEHNNNSHQIRRRTRQDQAIRNLFITILNSQNTMDHVTIRQHDNPRSRVATTIIIQARLNRIISGTQSRYSKGNINTKRRPIRLFSRHPLNVGFQINRGVQLILHGAHLDRGPIGVTTNHPPHVNVNSSGHAPTKGRFLRRVHSPQGNFSSSCRDFNVNHTQRDTFCFVRCCWQLGWFA